MKRALCILAVASCGPAAPELDSPASSTSTMTSSGWTSESSSDLSSTSFADLPDPADLPAPDRDRLVFVTSEAYNGQFAIEGALGVDHYCHLAAVLAGFGDDLHPSFRAFIETETEHAVDRVYHSPGRYVLVTGDVVAEDWADLMDGELAHAINVDENGAEMNGAVWTGFGTAPLTCEGWTTNDIDPVGSWGRSDYVDSQAFYFTDEAGVNPTTCAASRSLYCFETHVGEQGWEHL